MALGVGALVFVLGRAAVDAISHSVFDEPRPRWSDDLRERYWPPAVAASLRSRGWKKRAGLLFDYTFGSLASVGLMLVAFQSDDELRRAGAVAVATLAGSALVVLALALVRELTADEAPPRLPPDM